MRHAITGWLFLIFCPAAEGSSAIGHAELRSMVDEIAPIVADVAGRDFESLPPVVLADLRQLSEVIYEEQRHLLASADGAVPEEVESSARRRSLEQASSFAGKYGLLDGRLYVSVDEIRYTLGERGSPERLLRPLVRIVIAHELAHALQAQHTNLDRLTHAAPGKDALMALNCALEGHATWVHEAVAARMGLDEAEALMAQLMGYDEPIQGRMDPDAFYPSYVYGLGRDFVAFHAQEGGTDQVWRVLQHPPVGTSEIVSPETWGDLIDGIDPTLQHALIQASRRLTYRAWPTRTLRALTRSAWEPGASPTGDYDLRDLMIRTGGEVELASELEGGWSASFMGRSGEGIEVKLLRFRDPGGAQAYVAEMRRHATVTQAETLALMSFVDDLQRTDAVSEAEASALGGSFDVSVEPFTHVESDVSAREQIAIQLFGIGPREQLSRIWVARGADVVEVVTMNPRVGDRRIAASIEGVFRALAHR
ncbi:MAG TPA: hypothetical protein ENK18_28430 [Deltaproteobacteria bacterium]|nr:hypothetical protein [Deltaproteobacteria bacterium]